MDKRNVVLDGSNEEASERLSQIIKKLDALDIKKIHEMMRQALISSV